MRVAAIDCGTNSVRLLIADTDGRALTDVVRELEVVRLGQDVDRTGVLAPEALARIRPVLARYAATIAEHGATAVRMVATSATRDAANRDEFAALVHAELGVVPEVVSGFEEARLSFVGATGVVDPGAGPVIVTDIGGGSSELVTDTVDGLRAHSMQVGSVRLTERHVRDDPPTPAQVAAVVGDVRDALDLARADVPFGPDATLVGVAGTVTTLAGIALGLDRYDSARIHGARLDPAAVVAVSDRVLAMSRDERAALPVMHPGRVDVIGAGALVLRTIVETLAPRVVIVSEHDILDGIALGLAEGVAG